MEINFKTTGLNCGRQRLRFRFSSYRRYGSFDDEVEVLMFFFTELYLGSSGFSDSVNHMTNKISVLSLRFRTKFSRILMNASYTQHSPVQA